MLSNKTPSEVPCTTTSLRTFVDTPSPSVECWIDKDAINHIFQVIGRLHTDDDDLLEAHKAILEAGFTSPSDFITRNDQTILSLQRDCKWRTYSVSYFSISKDSELENLHL